MTVAIHVRLLVRLSLMSQSYASNVRNKELKTSPYYASWLKTMVLNFVRERTIFSREVFEEQHVNCSNANSMPLPPPPTHPIFSTNPVLLTYDNDGFVCTV